MLRLPDSLKQEIPQNATNIVAEKYFRGRLNSPTREPSAKRMKARAAGTIADLGRTTLDPAPQRRFAACSSQGDVVIHAPVTAVPGRRARQRSLPSVIW